MPSTVSPQQHTVALDAIRAEEDFNPRSDVARAEIDGLADSIARHGLIQPLVVARADGDGAHRLIDGERRYRACVKAGLTEAPVIVHDGAPETAGLELALISNMKRVDLDVVEQAKGFQRLIDRGLTRKGVAAELGVSQKLIRERLALLALDEALHPRLADGTIPPGAVQALCGLAELHPALPAAAVAAIVDAPQDDDYYYEPPTWSELARDALGVVTSVGKLPAGVFKTHEGYPIARFSLSDGAAAALEEYSEMANSDHEAMTVSFGPEDLDAAEALGAGHRTANGVSALIVGQEVADQLVGDQITAALEAQHDEVERVATAADPNTGAGGPGAPIDEQAAHQERRRQRDAEQEAWRAAVAYNDELAAAIIHRLGKVRLDERVVKILAAVNLGDELDKLALRGARYGFPGFESQEELKSGKVKRTYVGSGDAGARARTWLSNAKGPVRSPAGRSRWWRWPATPTSGRWRSPRGHSGPSTAAGHCRGHRRHSSSSTSSVRSACQRTCSSPAASSARPTASGVRSCARTRRGSPPSSSNSPNARPTNGPRCSSRPRSGPGPTAPSCGVSRTPRPSAQAEATDTAAAAQEG